MDRKPTHLEITIPTNDISHHEIPRILLNLRTYLEQPCPTPTLYQLTHNIDTNITIQQIWLLCHAGQSQGGGDIFRVCPPDQLLDVSRWRHYVYGLHTITAQAAANDGNDVVLWTSAVEHSQEEMAHNITTRRKYGIRDNGGAIIATIPGNYHRERYLSWLFSGLESSLCLSAEYGWQLEVREYLGTPDFRVILRVPLVEGNVQEKITLINKTEELQQLLHRLCYICSPS